MVDGSARRGWDSTFEGFRSASASEVIARLRAFVTDAGQEQLRAWSDSIPRLQVEVDERIQARSASSRDTALLEYEMPLEARRADVVLLVSGAVVVLELKGKQEPSQADLDQASAYARDLRCYHESCELVPVHAVLVPMRSRGYLGMLGGVHVCGPDAIDVLLSRLESDDAGSISASEFLSVDRYRPLPSLVRAARELFETGSLRRVKRAAAATQPALDRVTSIVHEAARTKSRRLILLSGVPGSGKTLVGLQLVHAHFLDDLAVARDDGKPTAPAVFLSGNAPLVEVLQYELSGAGGDGKTFVRGVKDYLRTYSSKRHAVPPQHVLVFDEAQRAWDADYAAEKHGGVRLSEPERFIELAERVPDWCVVLGLVGSGQEIHMGEEGGLRQWTEAISRSPHREEWVVHASGAVLSRIESAQVAQRCAEELTLTAELRFHLTRDVHAFVAALLEHGDGSRCADLSRTLEEGGYSLRMVREIEVGQEYLRDRFSNDPDARFGLIASSRDRDLKRFRVYNDFQSTKRIRVGPWFGASEATGGPDSCCSFERCVTEFQCQGLELEAALVAWGTDLRRVNGGWSSEGASKYLRKGRASVKDPHQLRVNAYRVLLTRGRNATVIFVPRLAELDETAAFLELAGFKPLS